MLNSVEQLIWGYFHQKDIFYSNLETHNIYSFLLKQFNEFDEKDRGIEYDEVVNTYATFITLTEYVDMDFEGKAQVVADYESFEFLTQTILAGYAHKTFHELKSDGEKTDYEIFFEILNELNSNEIEIEKYHSIVSLISLFYCLYFTDYLAATFFDNPIATDDIDTSILLCQQSSIKLYEEFSDNKVFNYSNIPLQRQLIKANIDIENVIQSTTGIPTTLKPIIDKSQAMRKAVIDLYLEAIAEKPSRASDSAGKICKLLRRSIALHPSADDYIKRFNKKKHEITDRFIENVIQKYRQWLKDPTKISSINADGKYIS